jgi:hypothetical protein
MLERGFLAGKSFYACYAHQNKQVQNYIEATEEVFELISQGQEKGTLRKLLKGPEASSGFRRLT